MKTIVCYFGLRVCTIGQQVESKKCTREVLLIKLLARILKLRGIRGIMRFVLGRVFGGIRKEDIDPFIGDDKNSIRECNKKW